MIKRIASAVAVVASLAAFSAISVATTAPAQGTVGARPVGCC